MKKQRALCFSLCLVSSSLMPYAGQEHFGVYKRDLIEALRTADQQRDILCALLEHKEVDLKQLSLDDLNQTVTKLEGYRERILAQEQAEGSLGAQETHCLRLTQELIRQLTNARLSYQQRIQSNASMKKIAVSAGAAVAVFGGLMLLNFLTPLDVSVTTALLCGLATGCVVGAITHMDELMRGVRSVSNVVQGSLPQNSTSLALKTVATIGVTAATIGLAWWKRDLLFRFLPRGKTAMHTLTALAEKKGIIEPHRVL